MAWVNVIFYGAVEYYIWVILQNHGLLFVQNKCTIINHKGMIYDDNNHHHSLLLVRFGAKNDVVSTSMQHNHVASTFIRRQFYVICPLGSKFRLPGLYQQGQKHELHFNYI